MRKKQLFRRKSRDNKVEEGPFFQSKKEKDTKQSPFFNNVQPKLSVSQPGDAAELQADKVADNYMANLQKKKEKENAVSRAEEEEMQAKMMRQEEEELQTQQEEEEVQMQKSEEEELQTKEQEEELQTKGEEEELQMQTEEIRKQEEEEVQTKIMRKSDTETSTTFETQLEAAKKAGGQPLPENLRKEYENLFKQDLKDVRVHTDDTAIDLCNKISAQAFTHHNHIFFNKGKYSPESAQGKHLLTHELTHVVQQSI